MIKSMTGFGQSVSSSGEATLSVEVKSLNSKFFDLSLRLPKKYSEKELEVRNLLAERLERGKVSFSIDYQTGLKQEIRQQYNEVLFESYYNELKKLADRVNGSHDSLFQMALSSPDVVQANGKEELDPVEWERVLALLKEAINKCDNFRAEEGKSLEAKLAGYIENIKQGLIEVEIIDPRRIEKIRSRIKGNITEFFGNEGFDANRLEQEIIFYIEKLDIHEERVRLKTHLDYFLKIMSEKQSNGKKLGFISQEIGREINTIGSKANDAEMQKHVVMMKEELEKIKEQLSNVL
ncbi:MAG: YicC/YloC family endoribonuclease [Cytophagales bacterium]|nr:YicC/YloC family endoribonuclease [Cytophagales bacterium]